MPLLSPVCSTFENNVSSVSNEANETPVGQVPKKNYNKKGLLCEQSAPVYNGSWKLPSFNPKPCCL